MSESRHDLLTAAEVIDYLRLNTGNRNAELALRNLVRRQRLPIIRRGGVVVFRRAAIDAWLDGTRIPSPVRQQAAQGVAATNGAARKRRAGE